MDNIQAATEGKVGKRVKAVYNPVFSAVELRDIAHTLQSIMIYLESASSYKPTISPTKKENLNRLIKTWLALQSDICLSKGMGPMMAKLPPDSRKKIKKAKVLVSKIAKKVSEENTNPVIPQEDLLAAMKTLIPETSDESPF